MNSDKQKELKKITLKALELGYEKGCSDTENGSQESPFEAASQLLSEFLESDEVKSKFDNDFFDCTLTNGESD